MLLRSQKRLRSSAAARSDLTADTPVKKQAKTAADPGNDSSTGPGTCAPTSSKPDAPESEPGASTAKQLTDSYHSPAAAQCQAESSLKASASASPAAAEGSSTLLQPSHHSQAASLDGPWTCLPHSLVRHICSFLPDKQDRLSLRLASPAFTQAVPFHGLKLCFPDRRSTYRTPSLAASPDLHIIELEQLSKGPEKLNKAGLRRLLTRLQADKAPACRQITLRLKLPLGGADLTSPDVTQLVTLLAGSGLLPKIRVLELHCSDIMLWSADALSEVPELRLTLPRLSAGNRIALAEGFHSNLEVLHLTDVCKRSEIIEVLSLCDADEMPYLRQLSLPEPASWSTQADRMLHAIGCREFQPRFPDFRHLDSLHLGAHIALCSCAMLELYEEMPSTFRMSEELEERVIMAAENFYDNMWENEWG